jgi:predicted DNA-binding transcriptional regulator AlpA
MQHQIEDSVSSTRSRSTPHRSKIMEDDFASRLRKPPVRALEPEPLLTAEDVARRLNVSTDWVWDHSSRKKPLLPVIRMGDGALRYRASGIEAFIDERERLSTLRRRA